METIEIKDFTDLPSGENSYQTGAIAPIEEQIDYEILSENKNLEYIDYLNLSEAVKVLGEFFDVHSAVFAKEASVCAVALGSSSETALEKALDCDPVAIFEGTAGFSKAISLDIAKQLCAMKIRNILAPNFAKEALTYLLNTNINVVKINTPLQELLGFCAKDIKVTPFGALIEEQNLSKLSKETFKVVTKTKPTQEEAEDAVFAWKVSKYLKSKSAVIAKDLATKAIIQGKSNGIITSEMAMDYACESSKKAVLAVDGVIENEETINAAIQGRIGLIIEAGNGRNSNKIVKLADKYNLSMIHTTIQNNRY